MDRELTLADWVEAETRHIEAYDIDDLHDTVFTHHEAILACLKRRDMYAVGRIFSETRRTVIRRRCEMELLNRVVTPEFAV